MQKPCCDCTCEQFNVQVDILLHKRSAWGFLIASPEARAGHARLFGTGLLLNHHGKSWSGLPGRPASEMTRVAFVS